MIKNVLKVINIRIEFYKSNCHLLPPKPKLNLRHVKNELQNLHSKYVFVPADKASNNVIIIWRIYYLNVLNKEITSTKAYSLVPLAEGNIISNHIDVCKKLKADVSLNHVKLPTMYWIPKLHKTPYKARFIAASSSCTTKYLSVLLTSCLSKIKENVQLYFRSTYNNSGKKYLFVNKKFRRCFNKT